MRPAETGRRGASRLGFVEHLKMISLQACLLILTVAAIDVIGFFALPEHIAANLPGYRVGFFVPAFIGRGYPKDYYLADAERGFDIRPTAEPRTYQRHWVGGISYPVWSNKLGCFDRPHRELPPAFMYFAGDSNTWGYAPYEMKFGTVFERLNGIEILKCGVSHTGQRHQFSKFVEIGAKLGRWPAKVVVFYYANDVANDYAHPHSTVIDGGLADVVRLDDGNGVVKLDAEWFEQARARIAEWNRRREQKQADVAPSHLLMQYSMTAQLVNAALHAIRARIPVLEAYVGVLGDEPFLHWADKYELYKGRRLYDIHRLTYLQSRNGIYEYENFKYADENKKAILDWSHHARTHGYELEFVLLPPGEILVSEEQNQRTDFYRELKSFLTRSGIKSHDLAKELWHREIGWEEIYWGIDAHFSSAGNVIIGQILAELLRAPASLEARKPPGD